MHVSSILAVLAPATLISAYTAKLSKQYCDQKRVLAIRFSANLGTCYNTDGAASYEFSDVAAGGSYICAVYTSANCGGTTAALYDIYGTSSQCANSPIGWIYSYKCYLK
ncbi:uncharacterized protein GLRG_00783 [Colletotrichum graminicola M1.001]|uniref:Uncharacterized protein n=1 Tax=Colletotrichum graminicola (strain M1.001 / M2 / FGSC 10212) TaxID=645133 RepID=E3Q3N7_COLGM|nr:uncharacterized protein GLRG_00783 [Colletotrichum graminicola M1.001]EFQ25639.1 hypothetical protein GLRG_00783 [Colletotrichum graminicola M1.001]